MNKITIENKSGNPNVVFMYEMPLGSIGVCLDSGFMGTVVRRSVCKDQFLVENLSNQGKDRCWMNNNCNIRVNLLSDAEIKVII